MWNCAHTAILYCFSRGHSSGMLTVDALRGVVWHPFAMAVDCLLDMLMHLQDEAEKTKKVRRMTSCTKQSFKLTWYLVLKVIPHICEWLPICRKCFLH